MRGGFATAGDAYAAPAPGRGRLEGFNGDISDLKHVVILMQENRSFDHYFGTLPGIRASTTGGRCGSGTVPASSSRTTATATSPPRPAPVA